MADLYDMLISNMQKDAVIRFAAAGCCRVLVEAEHVGIASLPMDEMRDHAAIVRNLQGSTLFAAAEACKDADPVSAACGLAAINAYYNQLPRLQHTAAELFPYGCSGGDVFAELLPSLRGKRVATIGHFPGVAEMYGRETDFFVFELDSRPGMLPAEAEEEMLPTMDTVFVTGMTISNHTLPDILRWSKGKTVVLLGPSIPLTPLWFELGVSVIAGTVISDAEAAKQLLHADGKGIYQASCKVIWKSGR